MRALLLTVLVLIAAPSFAAPVVQDNAFASNEAEPRGDRWNERWQGRRHYLEDDIATDAATDGHAANAQAGCHDVAVRIQRPDGGSGIRRIKRCD